MKELNAMTRLPQNSEENVEIVRTARILRLAFVAYLAAAWFLSRAYEPTFYVLNGMTAALAGVLRARSVASPAVAPAKVTRPASGLAAAANPGARPQLPVFGLGLAFRVAVIEIAIVCSIYVLMHIRSLQ